MHSKSTRLPLHKSLVRHTQLSDSDIDNSVLGVRKEVFEIYTTKDHSSTITITMPTEDAKFISARLSALLHTVQGARDCERITASHGANEAERRHEWDALLLKFFQPIAGRRDVL